MHSGEEMVFSALNISVLKKKFVNIDEQKDLVIPSHVD
jgi:hypothetical protein